MVHLSACNFLKFHMLKSNHRLRSGKLCVYYHKYLSNHCIIKSYCYCYNYCCCQSHFLIYLQLNPMLRSSGPSNLSINIQIYYTYRYINGANVY